MEKIIYLLTRPDGADTADLSARLRGEVVKSLQENGAQYIRVCVDDEHVAHTETLRQGDTLTTCWAAVTLWVQSRTLAPALESALSSVAGKLHGYAVAESEQLKYEFERDGARLEGLNELVCFRKPENLTRAEWLDIWLGSHTQIAIDTQSTFGYRQHIVGDVITGGSPHFDAIIEENFPAAAMTSQEAFYDCVGDPDEYQRRLGIMIESVLRFIDMETLEIMPATEYNF